MANTSITIRNIQHEIGEFGQRITADVDDVMVWYESKETALRATTETFASAFLLPAMMNGLSLSLDAPVTDIWLENASRLMSIFNTWWGYAPIRIESMTVKRETDNRQKRTALCFSGGVDSFYSLLRGPKIDDIFYVFGFDMTLKEEKRLQTYMKSFVAIASAVGVRPILIKTNLREHPLYKRDWEKKHGGALASTAYCISDINRCLISASFPYAYSHPWGSHWDSDPLWSDGEMTFVHLGAEKWRKEKLIDMVDEPLVQQHLRVCWKHLNENSNCCHCEKCIRTMLIVAGEKKLDHFPVFPHSEYLANHINQLSTIGKHLMPVYEAFQKDNIDRPVSNAITRLLYRSRAKQVMDKFNSLGKSLSSAWKWFLSQVRER